MFGFIAFGFKLIFAAILGGAFSYIPGNSSEDKRILDTSLICIFAAAILGLTSQFSGNVNGFAMGIGILSVIYITNSLSGKFEFTSRLTYLFSALAGIVIGAGYILQAILLTLLIYFILRNSESLLKYIEKDKTPEGDPATENLSN